LRVVLAHVPSHFVDNLHLLSEVAGNEVSVV
jgi:hypothetical protein